MLKTRTKIDWLGLSVRDDPQAVRAFYSGLFQHIGAAQFETGHGKHGFKSGARVTIGGAEVGLWLWGGASQNGRSYIDVNGLGCGLVECWERAHGAIERLPEVKAKRVDICADFYHGEVTFEQVREAYHAGKFTVRRRPSRNEWLSDTGRTFAVGARGNDMYFRGYEKGRKEFSELPAEMRRRGLLAWQGQDDERQPFDLDKWFRLELELRAKTRPLPLDVIPDRDQYFAGAYPFLQEVMPQIEPRVMVRPEHLAVAELEVALTHLQRQWGSTLFTALTCYGGDYATLMQRIVGGRHNERLVSAGVLLCAA